jgi:hypothetical protein
MPSPWTPITLESEAEVIQVFTELQGKRWISRGQANAEYSLVPSIDREGREKFSRRQKLRLERQSIDMFRSTARFFADKGEEDALKTDIQTLMVLRHYGVPTRLLDWSLSPFVAAYFAVEMDDSIDGAIWSFDHDQYVKKGSEQWIKWRHTTNNGDGVSFNGDLTAFTVEDPVDWFVCYFNPLGFPRQNAQHGAYSCTARLGRNHADKISDLLVEDIYYHRYVIPAKFKRGLRKILREEHGIWGGSLFPDSAGAAQTAKQTFIATQFAIAASLDQIGEFEPRQDDDSPRLDSIP